MNLILNQVLAIENWQSQYNFYAHKNILNSLNYRLINEQNFENFQNFIQTIVEKGPRKSKKRWVSNERRILHILLNCLSVIKNQTVNEFQASDILKIQRVFPYKDKYSIEYEIRKLSTTAQQNRRRWSQKQQNFLKDIVKKTQNKNKWNEIARQLFINSKGEFFRQGKHCRQRFYKLKDGKGQFSFSEPIQSDQESQHENSSQFHGHYDSKYSEKAPINQEILQNMGDPIFEKNYLNNQVDQISKKYKSSTHTENLGSSKIKTKEQQKSKQKKQRNTRLSLQGENSHSESKKNDLKNFQNIQVEDEESIALNIPLRTDIEEKENLEGQNAVYLQQQTPDMVIPGSEFNGVSFGYPTLQMPITNGIIDIGWYSLMGCWPLGAFSYNFQGFY